MPTDPRRNQSTAAHTPAPRGVSRLHHLGYVVPGIEEIAAPFAESLGATWEGRIILDPLQQVYVTFLARGGEPMVELVAPAGEKSPVASFLARGGGLHHLCYEVEDLETQLGLARSQGGIVTKKPLPAVAFNGRRIAWVYTKYKLLVEYLEK